MKKKKTALLILASLLTCCSLGSFTSCHNNNDQDTTKKDEDKVLDIRVTNLTDLSKEWKVGDPDREISLSIKSATSSLMSVDKLLSENRLTVTSSNSSVISVNKLTLKALKAGASTITVKADTEEVKFNLDIVEETGKDNVETKTIDELKNTDVDDTKYYKSEGVISSWYSGSDGGAYGNFYVSINWNSPASNILVYGATAKGFDEVITENNGKYTYKNPKDWNSNELTKDLKVGDKISFYCMRYDHTDGTKELYAWGVEYIEHKDYNQVKEPNSVAVDSLATVLNPEVGSTSNRKYTGKAVISKLEKSVYGNISLVDLDGSNEVTSYGSTATQNVIVWDGVEEVYRYSNPKDFLTNDLTKDLEVGCVVEFEMIRNTQEETEKKEKRVFTVIKSVVDKIQPTSLSVSGTTNEVEVSKSITLTCTTNPSYAIKSGITWASSDKSVATVENGKVTGVKEGTVKISAKYGKLVSNEFEVTVKPKSAVPEPVVYDFSTYTGDQNTSVTAEEVYNFITSSKCVAEGSNVIDKVTTVEKATLNCIQDKVSYAKLGLKFGTSKVAGKLSFTLSDADISKMTIKGIGWGNSDKIIVDDTTYTSSAAYTSGTIDEYEFNIDASKTITIDLNKRYFIQSITFDYTK